MNGPARRARDALGDRSVTRRRDIRSAHRGVRGAEEADRQIGEPVRIGVGVVVDVGDDLARGRGEARVARAGQAAVLGLDQPAVVLACDGGGRVGGSVVHHNDLVIRIGEARQSLETVADGARAVVRAHDHRDSGPREARRKRHLGERLPDRAQRGLGRPVDPREAEGPVLHVVALPVPLVGPGEHEDAGTAGGERAPHLPGERARLDALVVAEAVKPELAHEERSVPGEILETGQVGLEPVLRLEVDVEAHEVEAGQLEVFRRGVVHVRHEPAGVLLLDRPVEPLEVALDPSAAQPARHRRRDLVAEGVAQERRMTGALPDLRADQRLDLRHVLLPIDEEAEILLRG